MSIRILIETDGEKVLDFFQKRNTTLLENSLVLRRLEEIKLKLLSIDYSSEFKIDKEEDDN